jgi:hypothetical protein
MLRPSLDFALPDVAAAQPPVSAVFDLKNRAWNFTATRSALLANTQLPINTNAFTGLKPMKPTHDAA